MPPQHSDEDLLSELQSHNTYFDAVVNMIPARLYVAGASGDDAHIAKFRKGQHKESREARKALIKIAKRDKFRPEGRETTLEAKQRVAREREENDDSSDEEDADIEMSDGDENEKESAAMAVPAEKKDDSYASRIEMLRAKLHAKMAEKRAAGGTDAAANVNSAAPALVSKRAARRAEKRRRKEAASQRNKKRTPTAGQQKAEGPRVVRDLGGSTLNAPDPAHATSVATTSAAHDLETIDYQPLAGLKPRVVGTRNDKSLTGGKRKKKSLEHLLADAERKQERLRELKRSSADEDKNKAKNIEWGEALKEAGGAATKKTNDPKLLKKAIKRKAKQKTASSKAWHARVDQTKDAAAKKQQIRSHNLDARKLGGSAAANLSSKRIKTDDDGGEGEKTKRRRAGPHAQRAGFEGKKSGFINGEGSGAPRREGGGSGKK